jgi:hypothetical protein
MKILIDEDFIQTVAVTAIERKLNEDEYEEVYEVVFENIWEFVHHHIIDVINIRS